MNKKSEIRMSDSAALALGILGAGAGAVAGTAVAPGVGTVPGAISGVVLVALIKIAPGILWILFAIGGLIWISSTIGSMMTIIVGIGLAVLWLLFRK